MEILIKDISIIKGVGPARIKLLNKLDIYTVEDMLYYFPKSYEDRSIIKNIEDLIDGEEVCIKAQVFSKVNLIRVRKGLHIYKAVIRDETDEITAVWYNQKYISNNIIVGKTLIFYGKISIKYGKKEILNPIFEKEGQDSKYIGKIVPIYPLTFSLTQKVIQNIMDNCLQLTLKDIKEYLPQEIRSKYNLSEISYTLQNIHFPNKWPDFENARKRLVFEELFFLQLGILMIRNKRQMVQGIKFKNIKSIEKIINNLPFTLTNAQVRVINEIEQDLQLDKPMSRLVQGDVGSGKTVVAILASYITVKNKYQAAIMVPTEILAEQHYKSFYELLKNEGFNICLLTGSIPKKQKENIIKDIKNGKIDLVIGTHAIIQEGVEFCNLGLVITDEQHRFGVKQRALLASKGNNVHMLVMTATPIPRTLALILYGDLDISIIDELPPGRKKVNTYAVDNSMRKRIYSFIRKQVNEGRQVYVVCPLIEESETLELKPAIELAEKFKREIFPEFEIGLLHGKLKQQEKEEIMRRFIKGSINVLVSTTVIEVGVNVVNASVMIIENAERFGLSQLHQLRGRVGRGEDQSYCILFNSTNSKIATERMNIMKQTNDGFKISAKDLKLRGPGEFFGTQQHGIPNLKIANLFIDIDILKLAQEAAMELIKNHFILSEQDSIQLKKQLSKLFSNNHDFKVQL